jgi:hypothetical protein
MTKCLVLSLVLALLSEPASAQPNVPPRPTPAPSAIVAAPLPPDEVRRLYSAQARRLVRGYLRLQMLELRKAELDRVRAVIEGKLGVDALFSPQPAQAVKGAPGR